MPTGAALSLTPSPDRPTILGVDAGTVARAARQFAERVAGQMPDRIQTVILFGSWARRRARPDSDIDIFVVVDRRDAAVVDAIQAVALEVDLEHLTYLSVKVCPVAKREEMRRIGDPFLSSIENEGQILWTRTSKAVSATG
jgi:predicted nucleotidyltransferase